MKQTLGSLMAMLAQQCGTTVAPLSDSGRQIAPAVSTRQELGNDIESVPGEEAGVPNEIATARDNRAWLQHCCWSKTWSWSVERDRDRRVPRGCRRTRVPYPRPTRNERPVRAYRSGGP